jgi:hypothetical protein
VIRSRIQVVLHALVNRLHVTPCDERIDQTVAALSHEVVVGEAEAAPVVEVVRQVEIPENVPPRDRPRLVGIRLQNHGLLWQEPGTRTENTTSLRCVVGRDEIRVSTLRPPSRQGEHPWAKRGEHTRRRPCRLRGTIDQGCLVHPIKVAAHGRERLLVLVPSDTLHEACMTHAEAKHEPIGIGLAQRELSRRHREWVTGPDVGDARRDHHAVGRRQQEAGVSQRLAVDRLADL